MTAACAREDVVAPIADVGNAQTGDLAKTFAQREDVGDRLARMRLGGERVNDGHGGGARKTLESRMIVGADDDGVDITGEDARGVFGRLPRTDRKLRALREERLRAQVRQGHFERNSRSQAGLFEEKGHGAPFEQRALFAPGTLLQEASQAEQTAQLGRAKIVDL